LLARNAGLDSGVEILGIDAQDAVHLRQVYADAALQRRDMAFERSAGAKSDDRRLRGGAEPDDLGDLLGAVREGDGIGGARRVIGFVLAVLLADRGRRRQAITEALAQ
jgi:hypothetical protein